VAEDVWGLYRRFSERAGPRPTLIERDNNIPPLGNLVAECHRAKQLMDQGSIVHA